MRRRAVDAEFLRVIASFAVVLNHVAGRNTSQDIMTAGFILPCFLNALSHFSVPVFIMISGRFMLDKEVSIKNAMKHAAKCIVMLVVWKSVYFAAELVNNGAEAAFAMSEPEHLWYFYTAAVLYLQTPPLAVFVKHTSEKVYRYVLIFTFFIGSFIKPALDCGVGGTFLCTMIEKMHIDATLGFMWCYLFGHYVYKYSTREKIIMIIGAAGAAVTFLGTLILSVYANECDYRLFSFFAPKGESVVT